MIPAYKNTLQYTRSACILWNLPHSRNHNVWAAKRKQKSNHDVALEYFDNVYGSLFGEKWPSIRVALLSPSKYCAVVNNYSDPEQLSTQLQNRGAINIREMFEVQHRAIIEKRVKMKRKKEMKNIFDLEKKIEELASRTRNEELNKIYPEGIDRLPVENKDLEKQLEDKELIKKAKAPLEESLAEAVIDFDRQIDPNEGLSSSRLREFVPVTELKGKEGFVSEADHFSFFSETKDFPISVESEQNLNFPSHLQVFTFGHGDLTRFISPKTETTGVMGYYLMDAGSILPVLALGLTPGDTVLDMCAAPGGKSLLTLQTLYPDLVVCNDSSLSRLNRVKRVMEQYFYDWEDKVKLSNLHGTYIQDNNTFSKILVDVPCTNDRHSVMESDNNIFTPSRNKERIMLPQLQVDLLVHALKLVKRGGSVVYSTCSLNPGQNDGVVHMALRRIWEETNHKIVVKDLNQALEPARILFQFAEPQCVRYGSLVVPYLPSNFGPMYFCKLDKIE